MTVRIEDVLKPEIYAQKVPCSSCPFRKTIERKIAAYDSVSMLQYATYFLELPGATFPCHKSVPKDDDRSTWSSWRDGQVLCVGGLLFAAKLGRANSIVLYGIARGWYDPRQHAAAELALVCDSLEELADDSR